MVSDRQAWLDKSCARARIALQNRSAPSDRLALIQTLARLNGGRIDLSQEGLSLSPDEFAMLPRFGLRTTRGDSAVRIEDSDLDDLPDGLQTGLALDPEVRTVFATSSPDAPLLRFSHHDRYRSTTQKAALNALLTMPPGGTLMLSMPTGSGKSLLFQIAPLFWRNAVPGACVVVVTPTIALADDHERTLKSLPGLENSRALTGALSSSEREDILNRFRRGEIPILLLSPEAAFGSARTQLLEAALPSEAKHGLAARLVGFFVDEAHIIESWGRTFRPDFQRLPALVEALIERNAKLRTILLSATLPRAARDVLRNSYRHGPWLEIHAGVPRYDFDLIVETFEDEGQRNQSLLTLVDRMPRPAIIYTTLVEHAETLHQQLVTERGYMQVALFTGDVSDAAERKRIVQDWADERLDIVVATSAFGLGIDKQNVRAVIHACLPEGPARYYQEIGRASRDGHQGLAACLWTRWRPGLQGTDEELASDMATTSWLSREIAEQRWLALLNEAEMSWNEARRRMRVKLDSARESLGRRTGEKNRRWNMSLLNLMQRAGAIRIEHVAEPDMGSPVWEFQILDDGLLSSSILLEEAWDRIFLVRESERSAAREELTQFKVLMSGKRRDCLLTGVFGLIEPETWDTPPCGRCPTCRARGTRPPSSLQPRTHTELWAKAASMVALPPGIILLSPDDPTFSRGLPNLLQRLSAIGFEQFIVPEAIVHSTALMLRDGKVRFGFLHGQVSWIRGSEAIADVPTAILLSADHGETSDFIQKLFELSKERPYQTIVLVADASRRIDGRPLGQFASHLAFYDEETLEKLTVDRLWQPPEGVDL